MPPVHIPLLLANMTNPPDNRIPPRHPRVQRHKASPPPRCGYANSCSLILATYHTPLTLCGTQHRQSPNPNNGHKHTGSPPTTFLLSYTIQRKPTPSPTTQTSRDVKFSFKSQSGSSSDAASLHWYMLASDLSTNHSLSNLFSWHRHLMCRHPAPWSPITQWRLPKSESGT